MENSLYAPCEKIRPIAGWNNYGNRWRLLRQRPYDTDGRGQLGCRSQSRLGVAPRVQVVADGASRRIRGLKIEETLFRMNSLFFVALVIENRRHMPVAIWCG